MQFNSIPTTLRVPFAYLEFSNSEANTSTVAQVYKLLLIGQKVAAGSQPVNSPIRVSSEKQAANLFGKGSMLYDMVVASLKVNRFTETWAVALADAGAGVATTGTLTVSGPATADGALTVYFGGVPVSIPVASGDVANDIAADLGAAINANSNVLVTASVATNVVTYTFKHKGLLGNDYPVSFGLNDEVFPAGVDVAPVHGTNGALNPDIQDAIDSIGDMQFRVIVSPYTDASNLTKWETELANRWGPLKSNDGHVFAAVNVDSGAAISLGLSRNSPHSSILFNGGSPTPSFIAAAILGSVVSFYSPIDQARPLQTLPLTGIIAPRPEDRLILEERNTLLYSGIATSTVDAGGVVRIERLITTHKEDAIGNPDESYLDYETLAILSYLRFSFRAYFGTKYPRHKLADDGAVRYAPGQPIMTPKLARAEAISLFADWEEAGLVEDASQFAAELVVERNTTDKNRLDFYLPPNLINGLRVIAGQIAFRS